MSVHSRPVVRSVGDRYDVYPAGVSVWNMLGAEGAKVRDSGPGGCGGHADELETSMLLHLRPQLVDMSKATAVDTVDHHSRFYSGDLFLSALEPRGLPGIFIPPRQGFTAIRHRRQQRRGASSLKSSCGTATSSSWSSTGTRAA